MQQASRQDRPEDRLVEAVRLLERSVWEWRAVHLHLSRLRSSNRRPYHLDIVASELEPLLRDHPGELYRIGNDDVVCLCKGVSATALGEVVLRLRHLFSNDPLLSDPAADETRFCTWYDLETEHEKLLVAAQELAAEAPRRGGDTDGQGRGAPLDAAAFARLEHALARADISPMLRSQAICTLADSAAPTPVLSEFFVSIAELGRGLAPSVDLLLDRWLFHRLTSTLDQRLLTALVGDPPGLITGHMSINLNIASVFTPRFSDLDRLLETLEAVELVVEFQLVDVFADLGAYVFARDCLHERGHGVCIDGLHHLHLPLVSRCKLGADLVKILWSPELLDLPAAKEAEQLRAAIADNGSERVVFCRCGSAEAVEWGQQAGIRLFQGRYVDSRLRALRPSAVAQAREALRQTMAG